MSLLPILFISCFFCVGKAKDCGGNIVTKTIIVGKDGHAAFSTIQAAIDSVRSNNDQWVKIHIKAGLYIESVVIPINKPCIILEGEGTPKTIISHSDHQSLNNKATLLPFAPNLLASGITFKNSYNVATTKYKSYDEVSKTEPANAARLFGDKYFFHNCSFIGYQDTLYDHSGRHVFKDCYIQGEIDFIYGNGQSYYQNCLVYAVGKFQNLAGYVTANGRESADDPSGFVFEGGSIIGNGARPLMLKFCKGPGADTSNRVEWMKKLSSSDLKNKFSFASFINSDGWNCLINAVGRAPNFPGFVTAQGRNSADETSGFVFEGGSIIGNGARPLTLKLIVKDQELTLRIVFHG
ncbi:putative pectinesterase 10 [Vigna angularis]|uniref:putative pectinesterase 10 n=1 Tax=Phaseolus angularis TaxID=3914 RepID=UPI0022B363AC|nr:putative pectinesterase 10 [Vigna angularis]